MDRRSFFIENIWFAWKYISWKYDSCVDIKSCLIILWNINSLLPCKWLECHWQAANWKYLSLLFTWTSWTWRGVVGGLSILVQSVSVPINHNFTFSSGETTKEKQNSLKLSLCCGEEIGSLSTFFLKGFFEIWRDLEQCFSWCYSCHLLWSSQHVVNKIN